MHPTVKRIAFTGAGGGGKTSAMSFLADRIEDSGRIAWIVPEGARICLAARMGLGSDPHFQHVLTDLEVLKETWALRHAIERAEATGREVILILDRTRDDNDGYVTDEAVRRELERRYHGRALLPLSRLDGVIHMVTAADGAPEHYVQDEIRREPPEEAVATDRRLVQVYQGVEHRFVIGNNVASFQEKIRRAAAAACRIIGIPEPLEIERKLLVRAVDRAALAALNPVDVEIFQFYAADGARYRRRTLADGSETYSLERKYETERPEVRVAIPTPIDSRDFARALVDNRNAPCVEKLRKVFDHGHYRWEFDELRRPEGIMLLEVELPEAGENPTVPECFEIERDVTNEPAFSNAALAKAALAGA